MTKRDINDIVSQMTLEEKAMLCSGASTYKTEKIERLGIPEITMMDGPHGLRKQIEAEDWLGIHQSVKATGFPTASLSACSFDENLLFEMGQMLGKNCKKEDVDVLLGPGINIKRSPLCGRNFEYFSEDPLLAGKAGSAYVRGIQSEGVGASLKHFLANNQETRRRTQSSEMDERTLREIYATAFEIVVKEAKPWTVMAAYNKLDGVYLTESYNCLQKLLREEWGYDGMVVSDWEAVHSRSAAVRAGCHLTMPGDRTHDVELVESVKNGQTSEDVLNEACEKILELVFKCKESKHLDETYDYEKAHALAVRIAEESMVLLKNEDNILPLDMTKKIVFIGKFAEYMCVQGRGSSRVNAYKQLSMRDMISDTEIIYEEGFGFGQYDEEEKMVRAINAARDADVAVVFAGLPEGMESEGVDRYCMRLPICQNEFIHRLCDVNPNVIVVLQNGSPIEMPWEPKVKGILECYLAGEGAAEATWSILSGKVNPSGRLAETFPMRYEDTPAYLSWPGEGNRVEYPEGVFVGYRYYVSRDVKVLYPFGYGLSYTQFTYDNLRLSQNTFKAGDSLQVQVDVKNIGARVGKELVQLYVQADMTDMNVRRPLRELRAFQKVELQPYETKTVYFTLEKRAFAIWDKSTHQFRVPGGKYVVQVCSSAEDILLEAQVQVENEYQEGFVHYDWMSTIGELRQHPLGKEFMKEVEPRINAMLSHMSAAQNYLDVPYSEMRSKEVGLDAEPLDMLKKLLPDYSEEKWQELFHKLN